MILAATTKSLVKLEVDQSGQTIPLCLCGLSVWQAFKYTTEKNQEAGIQHLKAVQTSVFDTGAGSNLELNIVLAHSWSSDIFSLSPTIDGAAASRLEDRKKARYGKETYPEGASVQVIPLVLEHYGRWGEKC